MIDGTVPLSRWADENGLLVLNCDQQRMFMGKIEGVAILTPKKIVLDSDGKIPAVCLSGTNDPAARDNALRTLRGYIHD